MKKIFTKSQELYEQMDRMEKLLKKSKRLKGRNGNETFRSYVQLLRSASTKYGIAVEQERILNMFVEMIKN